MKNELDRLEDEFTEALGEALTEAKTGNRPDYLDSHGVLDRAQALAEALVTGRVADRVADRADYSDSYGVLNRAEALAEAYSKAHTEAIKAMIQAAKNG